MIPQENGIIVSAVEPIKNRRKIWIRKGKNLYNPETMPLMNGLWNSGITNVAGNTSGWYVVVPITGGKTYTISKKNTRTEFSSLNFTIVTTEKYPTSGTNILQISSNSSYLNEYTITAQANVKYLFIGLAVGSSLSDDIQAKAIEELMVEESNIKTSYEAFIEPKIYVKNKNENYEELLDQPTVSDLVSLSYGISYRRVGTDVEFFIDGSSLSIPNNLTEIRVLPIGLRPKNTIKFPLCVIGSGGTGISNIRLLIYNDGRVILQNFTTSATATAISFMSGYVRYSTL